MLSLAFAPIDATSTKLYLQVHRGYMTLPPLSWLMNFIDRGLNKWVLSQDRRVVESQSPQNSTSSNDMLFPNDRFIRHFREWLTGFIVR